MLDSKNQELISQKQQQIEKYNTLIVLQGELNAINDEQKYYEQLRAKCIKNAQRKLKDAKDFEKLQEISKQQKEQIKKITTEIQTLRLKIKPQNQFLLNERSTQDQISPQIVSFPGYAHDVCEDSPRTQRTFSSKASAISKVSTSDDARSDTSSLSRPSTSRL